MSGIWPKEVHKYLFHTCGFGVSSYTCVFLLQFLILSREVGCSLHSGHISYELSAGFVCSTNHIDHELVRLIKKFPSKDSLRRLPIRKCAKAIFDGFLNLI